MMTVVTRSLAALSGLLMASAALAQMVDATETGRGVLVLQPSVELTGIKTSDYLLKVEVRQIAPDNPHLPTSGFVELRSLANGTTVSLGEFSLFPAPGSPADVYSFNFDLKRVEGEMAKLGPGFEVEVVSVNSATGAPTSTANYEVVRASLQQKPTQ